MDMIAKSAAPDFLQRAEALSDSIIAYRRHIHRHPELSFSESETAAYIVESLTRLGLEPRSAIGGNGVVCDIGSKHGNIVALRADMDALPIEESNPADYCSTRPGVMHACGHDAHVACLLGAAHLLAQNPPSTGLIRLIFQPAEEDTNDDGLSGATLMLRDGAFEGVKSVVALHVDPTLEPGKFGIRSGPILAACDKFDITIRGRGAHGALPHQGVDAVVIAAQVVQTIQTIVSRRLPPTDPAVVTIGGIRSATYRPNIIADLVEMTGTARYFQKAHHQTIGAEVENACRAAVLSGGSYELRYINENPALVNDANVVAQVTAAACELFGDKAVVAQDLMMGAEDFSFLSDAFPSCFIFLGTRKADGQTLWHTNTFDIDESTLASGAALLVAAALRLLA